MKISAGILMYRRRGGDLEVLLVHPGGPFFRNRDDGAWTVPKGEISEGENLLQRAKIEFREELGIEPPDSEFAPLGSIKQKGGKTVHAWAIEGTLPDDFQPASNSFSVEWPPRSGKMNQFPEVDRAQFFSLPDARQKINPAQIAFLDRLVNSLTLP